MAAIRVVRYEQERELAGESVVIFLKGGGKFNLKVTATEPGFITGYDDERLNLTIAVQDIDCVLGGRDIGRRYEYIEQQGFPTTNAPKHGKQMGRDESGS